MTAAGPLDLPDLTGLTVLVVDDNDDAVEILATFLKACGAHVLFARSARDGLAHIEATPRLDAVVTDVSMPQMDGVEFARRIRQDPRRHSLPVIALTGFYEQHKKTAEFNACLRKPCNFDELCNTITSFARSA